MADGRGGIENGRVVKPVGRWGAERWTSLLVSVITGGAAAVLGIYCLQSPPPPNSPGAVYVGIRGDRVDKPLRVDVDLEFRAKEASTEFRLFLWGDPHKPVTPEFTQDLVVGFCGEMAQATLWHYHDAIPPRPPLGGFSFRISQQSLSLAEVNTCQEFDVPQEWLTRSFRAAEEGGGSWGSDPITGSVGFRMQTSSASTVRVTLPRVVTVSEFRQSTRLVSMPSSDSVASIRCLSLPNVLSVLDANPPLSDAGQRTWTFPLIEWQPRSGHTLVASDTAQNATIQRLMFLASGLVGVCGSSTIWFAGTLGKVRGTFSAQREKVVLAAEPLNLPSLRGIAFLAVQVAVLKILRRR